MDKTRDNNDRNGEKRVFIRSEKRRAETLVRGKKKKKGNGSRQGCFAAYLPAYLQHTCLSPFLQGQNRSKMRCGRWGYVCCDVLHRSFVGLGE